MGYPSKDRLPGPHELHEPRGWWLSLASNGYYRYLLTWDMPIYINGQIDLNHTRGKMERNIWRKLWVWTGSITNRTHVLRERNAHWREFEWWESRLNLCDQLWFGIRQKHNHENAKELVNFWPHPISEKYDWIEPCLEDVLHSNRRGGKEEKTLLFRRSEMPEENS